MRTLLQLVSLAILVTVAIGKELPGRNVARKTPSQFELDLDRLPMNMAVVDGSEVTITCAVQNPSTGHNVQWIEYVSNPPNPVPISSNEFIGNHPEAARYTIIHNDDYEYSLRISPVRMSDGGTYQCQDATVSPPLKRAHAMQLTVVAAQPNCTTTVRESGVVLDGSYNTNDCTLDYKGGIIPNMTWSGALPFGQLYIAGVNSVWAGMQYNVTRDMDTRVHQLLINFLPYFLPLPADNAENVPDYTYLNNSRQMNVVWGPTSLAASPLKTRYDAGDIITCTADAYPTGTFFWQNMRTNEITPGATVRVSESWMGFNQSMRCEARNLIEGTTYSNNIFIPVDVNPLTTPTTTLPTTTTTPPPPEAPCTDLSGAWVSTSPTPGSLCVKLDLSFAGALTGLLKNATDTYWVDIIGRATARNFDQVGFNGIWPAEIGVSSFVGECHRCFGVEELLVNVVSRNKGPPCGNPGSIRYTTQYRFTRSSTLQCPNLPSLL